MSSFEDDLRVEIMRMQDEHSRALKALPEDTLLDIVSRNLYECLGVVLRHSRMASQFLELASKGSFTRENLGCGMDWSRTWIRLSSTQAKRGSGFGICGRGPRCEKTARKGRKDDTTMEKNKMKAEDQANVDMQEELAQKYLHALQAIAGWAIQVQQKHGTALPRKLLAEGRLLVAKVHLAKYVWDSIVED